LEQEGKIEQIGGEGEVCEVSTAVIHLKQKETEMSGPAIYTAKLKKELTIL